MVVRAQCSTFLVLGGAAGIIIGLSAGIALGNWWWAPLPLGVASCWYGIELLRHSSGWQ